MLSRSTRCRSVAVPFAPTIAEETVEGVQPLIESVDVYTERRGRGRVPSAVGQVGIHRREQGDAPALLLAQDRPQLCLDETCQLLAAGVGEQDPVYTESLCRCRLTGAAERGQDVDRLLRLPVALGEFGGAPRRTGDAYRARCPGMLTLAVQQSGRVLARNDDEGARAVLGDDATGGQLDVVLGRGRLVIVDDLQHHHAVGPRRVQTGEAGLALHALARHARSGDEIEEEGIPSQDGRLRRRPLGDQGECNGGHRTIEQQQLVRRRFAGAGQHERAEVASGEEHGTCDEVSVRELNGRSGFGGGRGHGC